VPSPSSASSTVVRYLLDIFVMYSVFVGGNCRYVELSDVLQLETYRWVQRFRKKLRLPLLSRRKS
jgi:hypothetical protein